MGVVNSTQEVRRPFPFCGKRSGKSIPEGGNRRCKGLEVGKSSSLCQKGHCDWLQGMRDRGGAMRCEG